MRDCRWLVNIPSRIAPDGGSPTYPYSVCPRCDVSRRVVVTVLGEVQKQIFPTIALCARCVGGVSIAAVAAVAPGFLQSAAEGSATGSRVFVGGRHAFYALHGAVGWGGLRGCGVLFGPGARRAYRGTARRIAIRSPCGAEGGWRPAQAWRSPVFGLRCRLRAEVVGWRVGRWSCRTWGCARCAGGVGDVSRVDGRVGRAGRGQAR